ncbi:MAG: DoxX family protein [Acidimicrobiales bacterium]
MSDLATSDFNLIMLVFRVLFGLTFFSHGYAKQFQGGKIAGTAGWFDSMGMKPGKVHAQLAAGTEMGAGLLMALGLVTPLAAAAVVGVMVVAGYTVHRGNFAVVKNGWEYTFVTALLAVAIAGLGPGEWSIDEALGLTDDVNGLVGAAIALVVGVAAGIGQIAAFYRPPAEG